MLNLEKPTNKPKKKNNLKKKNTALQDKVYM